MASLSTPNISKAFSEGNDLDTTMDRALYYEPVNHVLKKYSAFCLTEDDIARIVNKNSGDEEYLTNLLMEHHEALSILGISDIQSLYYLLLSLLTLSNPALVKGWKVPAEKDQLMEIEISEAPKIPKHQSKAAAQQEEPMSDLSAKTTPFTPKGKQKRVLYTNMVKQDPKDNVSRLSSPSPSGKKKRKTALVLKLIIVKVISRLLRNNLLQLHLKLFVPL
ncbi:unnamed protein product [Rhizophagus irregularis]|uniref:Uncharacterized protein n=1 Tax=Rhizophagus irregularis TaxID=588596 RepID=A0A915YUB2_9GLOM|nr:unnamed protein product [Rhizophagus irregularis]